VRLKVEARLQCDDSDGANKRKLAGDTIWQSPAQRGAELSPYSNKAAPGARRGRRGVAALHSSSPSVPQYAGMRPFASETCEMRTQPSTGANQHTRVRVRGRSRAAEPEHRRRETVQRAQRRIEQRTCPLRECYSNTRVCAPESRAPHALGELARALRLDEEGEVDGEVPRLIDYVHSPCH